MGTSFVPPLEDPEQLWESAASGRYRTGATLRTERYRYTEYFTGSGRLQAHMRYDHHLDPQEDVNISNREEKAALRRTLSRHLHTLLDRAREAETRAGIPGRR